MERLGEPALRRYEVHVTLYPSSQRFAWFVLGSQNQCSVGAGIDFTPEDGRDKVGALRKVAVNRPDADASLFGDLSDRGVYSGGCKHSQGRLEQRIDVALGVRAHAPARRAARLDARITMVLPPIRHCASIDKWNMVPYKYGAMFRLDQINAVTLRSQQIESIRSHHAN